MTKLGIPIGTRVMALKRLAYADHSPLMIEESYIAADRFPGLWEFDFEIGSLYETIEVHYGVKLASQRVEIILGKAEKYEAELLEITPGDPIIIEQGYSYSQDGELVEYSVNNSTTRIEYAGYASVEEDLSRG